MIMQHEHPRALFWAVLVFCVCWCLLAILHGCAHMDDAEMRRVHIITCPSVLEAYGDAVAAGFELTPEDQALVDECKKAVE